MAKPEDMQKFKDEYPFMYEKFWELNRALAKLQRVVGELKRDQDSSTKLREMGGQNDGTDDTYSPSLEID